jgi:uncharacterized membrane protein
MFNAANCSRSGLEGWLLMIGLWSLLLLVVLWTVSRLFPQSEPGPGAQALLERRLASGEIDPQTYRHLHETLVAGAAEEGRPDDA